MDTDSIVAALLHDVVEDTEITLEEIRKEFGKDVAFLVDGVTKLGRIPFSSREHQQAENVRKMLLAMVKKFPQGNFFIVGHKIRMRLRT